MHQFICWYVIVLPPLFGTIKQDQHVTDAKLLNLEGTLHIAINHGRLMEISDTMRGNEGGLHTGHTSFRIWEIFAAVTCKCGSSSMNWSC